MNEEQLIRDIKKNPQLFGSVYDLHYQTIFNYCFKRTGDFNSAKDITSETFLKAFLNIHRFRWRGVSIIHWLYRIATNEIKLHYRSRRYLPSLLAEIDIPFTSPDLLKEQEAAENEMTKHDQFLQVRTLLTQLPLKYQEVITLKYFEKLKIREISAVLNKPQGTIKSLLSRGISLMKDKM